MNLNRAAGKLFQAEAEQQQGREIGDTAGDYHYHQTHQAERHRPLRPFRHQIHHADERCRHDQHRDDQTQQEDEPDR